MLSTGIDAQISVNAFIALPNPAENVLTLKAVQPLKNEVLTLTDVEGRVIFMLANQNGTTVIIDMTQFESGLYILHISQQDHVSSIRIVKK